MNLLWGHPTGQSSLCDLPSPQLLGSVENRSLTDSYRKGSSSWWRLWAPGLSLRLPRGTAPHPSSDTLLRPTAQGILVSTSSRHTLPQALGLQGVLFQYFTLSLAAPKDDCILYHRLNFKELNPERPFSADLLLGWWEARYTVIHFLWKLRANPLRNFHLCLCSFTQHYQLSVPLMCKSAHVANACMNKAEPWE